MRPLSKAFSWTPLPWNKIPFNLLLFPIESVQSRTTMTYAVQRARFSLAATFDGDSFLAQHKFLHSNSFSIHNFIVYFYSKLTLRLRSFSGEVAVD